MKFEERDWEGIGDALFFFLFRVVACAHQSSIDRENVDTSDGLMLAYYIFTGGCPVLFMPSSYNCVMLVQGERCQVEVVI